MRRAVCTGVYTLAAIFLGAPLFAAEPAQIIIPIERSGSGTEVVTHPAAEKRRALAIDVSAVSGSCKLKTGPQKLDAGRYKLTFYVRLHQARLSDDVSRLVLDLNVGPLAGASGKRSAVWTQFDFTPDRFTPLAMEVTFASPATPTFELGWRQVSTSITEKVKPIRTIEPPAAPGLVTKKPNTQLVAGDDLLAELENENKTVPLAAITFPAVLLERIVVEPISRGQFVARVAPRYVHIYPEQENPIEATLRNLESRAVTAVAQLEIRAGLDEVIHTAKQTVELPPRSETVCRFDWTAGNREFGHEARVSLVVDGKPVHSASDYFSVSYPIWKTAIQGSGFLTWYSRLEQFPDHVAYNRAHYINVEEAFSWQPSSWTDLTPETEDWWTGQGNAHNSLVGLKRWMSLSHDQGIKMITYLWPTASGPAGLAWARENPDLVNHSAVGLPTEFFDVEDLRLAPFTAADPKLWRLRSGIWNYVGVNLSKLRGLNVGLDETIASAKQFGWDGCRFDTPPGAGPMDAQDVHAEFKELKLESVMKRLVPEHYDQTTGQWNGTAMSVRNIRYARHKLREAMPRFAISSNYGLDLATATEHQQQVYAASAAEGGQIMDEAIRQGTAMPWPAFAGRIRSQVDSARTRGGYHCIVAPSVQEPLGRAYMCIFMFAGGSHPYLDFGWGSPLPGNYTQFMTRYGEYCWSPDLEPLAGESAGFTVADASLLWRDYVRERKLADGRTQWVVHLISPPASETVTATKLGPVKPWLRGLNVGKQSSRTPIVWELSAEPTIRATPLTPRRAGDQYVVEVPEHRQWTFLVWTEPS